jgi:hypothetical protein
MGMMSATLIGIRRLVWPLLGGLGVILLVLLWLSPAERTLGQTVKLVYLHGALVRSAMVLFVVSLPVNMVPLLAGRSEWSVWGKVLIWTAISIWLVHTLFSMVTTYAAWGVFIAWFEPRTRFTFTLAVAAVIIVAISQLVDDARFCALAYLLLSGLTLSLAPRLGTIQHPLNPINSSPSSAIRIFYLGIQIVTLAIGGLVVVWLHGRLSPKH